MTTLNPVTTLNIALIQTRTPADPARAFEHVHPLITQAARDGAQLILLPECANLMEARKAQKALVVTTEDRDVFVQSVRELAAELQVSILIGSAIVQAEGANDSKGESRVANRTLLVDDGGQIVARYDKVHLFDADTPDGKSYRESDSVQPGERAVVAETPFGCLGLSICYDVRFAYLYRALAKAGAQMIAVPAAFTVPTGRAHWEVLLRTRAIETGCFILAPAQGGPHEDGRTTYGHSMVVSPWGEVIGRLDHDRPGILEVTIDLEEVAVARQALPQLQHDRELSA